jgi:hypothetical protein
MATIVRRSRTRVNLDFRRWRRAQVIGVMFDESRRDVRERRIEPAIEQTIGQTIVRTTVQKHVNPT